MTHLRLGDFNSSAATMDHCVFVVVVVIACVYQ